MAFNQYVRTSVSGSMAEARPKVIDLYRKAIRIVPLLIAQYELDFNPSAMKKRIRRDFDQHKSVTDPAMVDKLLFLGVVELEEARLMWKQTCHVEYYFERESSQLPGFRANLNDALDKSVPDFPRVSDINTIVKDANSLQYRE